MAGSISTSLQRMQSEQLMEHHRYLISRYADDCRSGLDVGCGSGLLISGIRDMIPMKGIDIDPDQVRKANNPDVIQGDGMKLPFGDRSFDLVVCSFYMMWVGDMDHAIREALRVARKKVIILSEPIWSRSILDPPELDSIVKAGIEKIRNEGGDPDGGLSVLYSLKSMGLDHRFGTIPMDTSPSEVMASVAVESEWADTELPVPEPVLFQVPFIWAVISR